MRALSCPFFLRSFVCFVFQVQAVGLQAAYRLDPDIRRLVQCLLALPLLPAREIPPTFSAIHERALTLGEETKTLLEYFVGVWISTRSRQATWEPTQWSQYQQAIWTNNDAEGWHRRLNTRAGHASLNFYRLLELLHHDSRLLAVHVSLLSTFNAAKPRSTPASSTAYGGVTPVVSLTGCSCWNAAGRCNAIRCNDRTRCKPLPGIHWNGKTVMLTTLWPLVAFEFVTVTSSSTGSDHKVISMVTFPFQCSV